MSAAEHERMQLAAKSKHAPAPDPRSKKEPSSSWWAKSAASSDRHQFQRVWPSKSFPSAAPQQSMVSAAPGPGAYGKSVTVSE